MQQIVKFRRCHWCLLISYILLSSVTVGFAEPLITEFIADNGSGLEDEDGEFSDWIEIYNPDNSPASLAGYSLTDDATNLNKWTFPEVTLEPDSFLIVFASGNNRMDPSANLHTNFQLSANGEYLALVAPDGKNIISALSPSYPPQFENDSFGLNSATEDDTWNYYSSPTPGALNGNGSKAGPIVSPVGPNPNQPEIGPLTISARVRTINDSIDSVTLFYRSMFSTERNLPMNDEGQEGDVLAGDGIWSATIPESAFAPAEMTRWRFVATDNQGTETKEPAYRNRRDSHEYFGTVAQDSNIQSSLPVLHWFIRSPSGAETTSGSRGALYYRGEFYDNIQFTRHGQSTAGFPKKSYNIDFNRTQRFLWDPDSPRVADIDLLTNWADKSKVRHVLAYEVMRESGVAAHFAHTLRVQQNGRFFSTADFVEDADETYLERAGLNRDGALYKVYDNTLNRDAGDRATSGVEKKTRKFENNADLQSLINGLDLRGTSLSNFLYDNIDIPRCVNLLAANSVIRNIDMHSKNWYIYRDTGRSDEWAILPWDLDLSHGRVWNRQDTYFDNRLYTNGFVVSGTAIRLVSHMFSNQEMRAMIMRRIRVLSDRFLQPPPAPGTPEIELFYERRLNEQSLLIDPPTIVPSDARLDFEKWGSWLQRGSNVDYTSNRPDVETMAEAIVRWKTEYLPARRRYIYNTQIIGRGGEIPLPQISGGPTTNYFPLVANRAIAKAHVPTDASLGNSWRGSPLQEPFDTSGWLSGPTGVGYDQGSTYDSLIGLDVRSEMRRNTSVYIRIDFQVENPTEIDLLELRLKYDDGFVAYLNGELVASSNTLEPVTWNSTSRLAHGANPRAYNVFDVSTAKDHLKSGRNILAIHGLNDDLNSRDMLIVPELFGGTVSAPTTLEPVIEFGMIQTNPSSGNQDEEFLQLFNPHEIAVDISNWQMTGAITYEFAPGTVIAPNASLYVSPNVSTFRSRAVSPKGGEGLFVQGGYRGHFSNFGETLTILDSTGMFNNEITFSSEASDAQRFLVISELMYRPSNDNLAEFVELLNISTSITLNLENIRFTQGVEFDFTESAITSLEPGARVLVVRDFAAFEKAYGLNLPVAGVFTNGSALSNGGERIKLEDANNGTILEFTYDDQTPWPTEPDQSGASLVLNNPQSRPDPSLSDNWRASVRPGGNPGKSDDAPFQGNPLADLNGNGEPDLVDYALGNDLGLEPLHPHFKLEMDAPTGEETLFVVVPTSLRAEGIEVMPYFSTDLVEWIDGALHLESVSMDPLDEGRALRVWRVKPPLRNQAHLFMRLNISER